VIANGNTLLESSASGLEQGNGNIPQYHARSANPSDSKDLWFHCFGRHGSVILVKGGALYLVDELGKHINRLTFVMLSEPGNRQKYVFK
jgi:hypothetical protein